MADELDFWKRKFRQKHAPILRRVLQETEGEGAEKAEPTGEKLDQKDAARPAR